MKNATIIGEGELVGNSFVNCVSLESIKIENGVTTIGNGAFSGCTSLKDVTLPISVQSIGERAFYDCISINKVNYNGLVDKWVAIKFADYTSNPTYFSKKLYVNDAELTDVVLTEGTKISHRAFVNCTSIRSVTISNTVTEIEGGAFSGCTSLSSVVLFNTLNKIGYYAFADCTSLSRIEMPTSLTEIKDNAFENCTSLSSVELPDGLSKIGVSAFANCEKLGQINLPTSLVEIKDNTFENCTSLSLVVLPNGLSKIGVSAFANCTSLTQIELPTSLTELKDSAFENCTSLAQITLGEKITYLGAKAFENTAYFNNSANWTSKILYIDNYLIKVLADAEMIMVKKEVKCVAVSAFAGLNVTTKVFFNGVASDFKVTIGADNSAFSKNVVYFYSEQEPQLNESGTEYSGKYWRYVDGVVTIWVYEAPKE